MKYGIFIGIMSFWIGLFSSATEGGSDKKADCTLTVSACAPEVSPNVVVVNERTVFSFSAAFYNKKRKIEDLPPGCEVSYTVSVPTGTTVHQINMPQYARVQKDDPCVWRKIFRPNSRYSKLDSSVSAKLSFAAAGVHTVTLTVEVFYQDTHWTASENISLTVVNSDITLCATMPKEETYTDPITGITLPLLKKQNTGHAFWNISTSPQNQLGGLIYKYL